MLTVISPAKRLDWTERRIATTEPRFRDEAGTLAGHMRQLPLKSLKSLMELSDDLARLNRDRFRDFETSPEPDTTRPALYAFAGDTYRGFDAASLDADARTYAQEHLRILSGLYGVLRPLDAIQPYRLEMGSRLKTRRGTNLYQFWGKRIAHELNETAATIGTEILVNCASQEYFSAVDRTALEPRVVTPEFYEVKDGAPPRMVGVFAKEARGAMARFIVERRIDDPEGIKEFDLGGYRFVGTDETGATLVFHRSQDGVER